MTKRLLYILLMIMQVLGVGACRKGVEPNGQGNGNQGQSNQGTNNQGEPITLTVATYNVLKPSGRRDEMSLDNLTVRQTLAKAIAETGADIIGFNELDDNYISGGQYSLASSCSTLNYSWRLEWPNDIHETPPVDYSYANGFAYNKAKLILKECTYVWLSKEENVWYTDASSAYLKVGSPERTCIRAKFQHSSGKLFWLFVTHLPTDSQGGAPNMAKVVNRYAKLSAGDLPAILTGDMNSAPGSAAYLNLTSYWQDGNSDATWGTLSGSSAKYYYSIGTFTSNHEDRRIDHIMTHGCTATDYQLVKTTYTSGGKTWCPSDHLPVKATVTIQ